MTWENQLALDDEIDMAVSFPSTIPRRGCLPITAHMTAPVLRDRGGRRAVPDRIILQHGPALGIDAPAPTYCHLGWFSARVPWWRSRQRGLR